MLTFNDTPLLSTLRASLKEQGIIQPTPIQAQTLEPLLDGRPLIGVSETGSGKTLAYVLPMLHALKTLELGGSTVSDAGRPRGLVLVPGRELGEQVSRVFKGLTHGTRLRVRVVLGGSKKKVARQNVGGKFEILVATPGRLTQLMDSGELRLDDVRILVVDEADQMMDAGFLPVAKRVVAACPKAVQIVMFSATLPSAVETVMGQVFNKPPLSIRTRGSGNVVASLTTDNRAIASSHRFYTLERILAHDSKTGTLLFANTRKQCDRIGEWLQQHSYAYVAYRGEMDRRERRQNLRRFQSGAVNLLIATDLGGRGLDIERIERVINVFLPQDIDNYLHRAGRTARAGRSGLVINLVTQRDHPLMARLKRREERMR